MLDLLKDVAADVITPRVRTLTRDQVAEKNPGDLVTVADRESEVRITAALKQAYPAAVVLGEEAVSERADLVDQFAEADHAFTVDPVDGTKNFVNGSPDHAVMVSEIRSGEVVRGWIWQPQHEASYVAEKGAGAWRNGVRLSVTDAGEAPPYRTARWAWVKQELGGNGGLGTLQISWACCGVDYPHVIAGDAAAVLYNRSMAWDHLPGGLILTEAGGKIGRLDGAPWQPRRLTGGLIAAGSVERYDAVVAALTAHPLPA